MKKYYEINQNGIRSSMSIETFKAFSDNVLGGILLCDLDGEFTINYVNAGFKALIGCGSEEFKIDGEHKLPEFIHEEDVNRFREVAEAQLKSGNFLNIEYRILKPDGLIIWVLNKGTRIFEQNRTDRLQCILTDITEHKLLEEKFELSEKRYEIAMTLSDITMFEYDIMAKELHLFEREAEIFGVPRMLSDGPMSFVKKGIVQPESADAYLEMYKKIHAGEPSASCVVNSKDVEGKTRYFELMLTSVFDINGNPVKAIGVRKNISEKLNLEMESAYNQTMLADKKFIWEADLTHDILVKINSEAVKSAEYKAGDKFTQIIKTIVEQNVAQEHQNEFLEKLSIKNLQRVYEEENGRLVFNYRTGEGNEERKWYKATVNIIRDEIRGILSLRFYRKDITNQVKKELRAIEEQRHYESMISKVLLAYETNYSKNQLLSGNEEWHKMFGIEFSGNYEEQTKEFASKVVHEEDRDLFLHKLDRKNIIENFHKGENEFSCEYRRCSGEGKYSWVSCNFHVYDDPETEELKGYIYIEDIDERKSVELALIYKAEHDSLTNCLNKISFEKHINKYLSENEAKNSKHAFLMMDIDRFKSINDNFGHLFGDAVLAQVSSNLRSIFRDGDFIGRIGGDEFAVFMKNAGSEVVMEKAAELCQVVYQEYLQKGRSFKISASVGIAMYREHGERYQELYQHADSALYVSKNNGRNRFSLYDENMNVMDYAEKLVDDSPLFSARGFDDNISEYIFHILYNSVDKEDSINAVLALVGKHFNVSRAYVFEDSENGLSLSNTFEWCCDGILAQKDQLQKLLYSELPGYKLNFNEDGIYFMPDVDKAAPSVRNRLEPQNVKSMLQFSIMRDKIFSGFIGFDYCNETKKMSETEILDFYSVSRILGVFIMEMRFTERVLASEKAAISIVNGLDSYAYVCDPANHQVLFINEKTLELAPGSKVGSKCHQVFWNRTSPCDVCPMKKLANEGNKKYSTELYNTNLKIWIKASASWIEWDGKKQVCLIDSVDISKYKEGESKALKSK